MKDIFWLFVLSLPIAFILSRYIRRRWIRILLSIPAGLIPVVIIIAGVFIFNPEPYFSVKRAFDDIIGGMFMVWIQMWSFGRALRKREQNENGTI
jgi:peptidoglycan/LPS O-acetylase OafA/YrhL